MTSLKEAHSLATAYWDTKGGTTGKVMAMRAAKAVELGGLDWGLPVSALTAVHATQVLTGLRKLALSSRATYYAAFRRMLALSGVGTVGWPSSGSVPRRTREPLTVGTFAALLGWLKEAGYSETVDLGAVLYGTGMRVEVEALSWSSSVWKHPGQPGDLLVVIGKGGHERTIPLSEATGKLLRDKSRMDAMRRLSYSAHLKRWNAGVQALGITSRLPTPHAVRHLYATEAYARCKDLHVVKELLGHADINTTARYIGVDMDQLREAAGA